MLYCKDEGVMTFILQFDDYVVFWSITFSYMETICKNVTVFKKLHIGVLVKNRISNDVCFLFWSAREQIGIPGWWFPFGNEHRAETNRFRCVKRQLPRQARKCSKRFSTSVKRVPIAMRAYKSMLCCTIRTLLGVKSGVRPWLPENHCARKDGKA